MFPLFMATRLELLVGYQSKIAGFPAILLVCEEEVTCLVQEQASVQEPAQVQASVQVQEWEPVVPLPESV